MKKNKSYSLAFLLSVVAHAMFALLLLLPPETFFTPTPRPPKTSEVELIDPSELLAQLKQKELEKLEKGQIVEQNEKRLNDEKPDDARFLSKFDQKVVQQTQAQMHGAFKNTDQSAGLQQQEKKAGKPHQEVGQNEEKRPEATPEKEVPLLTSNDGIPMKGPKPKLKDLMPSFKPGLPRVETEEVAQGGGEGPSATDDHLKDVKTGMQTLLSTREFVYYSYYNRIKAKLRQYWEPKIKEKMERIMRQGRAIASTQERVTRIIIILDGTGTLQRVQVVGASGVHDLDDAAVEAFRAAAPFPNPPKGIQESDGTIKIRWDFILEANANSLFDAIANGVKKL